MDPIAEVPLVAISKEKNTSEEPANMMRGTKMVALANFKRPNISVQNRSKRFSERDSIVTTVTEKRKEFSPKQRNIPKLVVREIERSLLVKTRSEPIGSGTFGNCFLVEYHGITAVVKEMNRQNDTPKESERCKEVLHEANVLHNLGNHENLPFLLGICTLKEPYSLVLQFHGAGQESVTLYKAIKEKFFDKVGTVKIFVDICKAVNYIHGKGYLHSDLKSNNVVLKQKKEIYSTTLSCKRHSLPTGAGLLYVN